MKKYPTTRYGLVFIWNKLNIKENIKELSCGFLYFLWRKLVKSWYTKAEIIIITFNVEYSDWGIFKILIIKSIEIQTLKELSKFLECSD